MTGSDFAQQKMPTFDGRFPKKYEPALKDFKALVSCAFGVDAQQSCTAETFSAKAAEITRSLAETLHPGHPVRTPDLAENLAVTCPPGPTPESDAGLPIIQVIF